MSKIFYLSLLFFSGALMADNNKNFDTIKKTYDEQYCAELEMAYGGDGMMSAGGGEQIDHMFAGIDLQGKNVLDFGSGLGGLAFHVAHKYGAVVTGVDISEYPVAEATRRTPEELLDKVSFVLIEDGICLPFADQSFDVVCSKGVMVHLTIEQRTKVFKEFKRVLKPGGKLVILDWLSPKDNEWGPLVARLIEVESLPLTAITPTSYVALLESIGFTHVGFEDWSEEDIAYDRAIVNRLESPEIKNLFIEKFGETTWQEHIQGYRDIVEVHKSGEAITGFIKATKPTAETQCQ